MSLRARILIAVTIVNLGVTGLLLGLLVNDLSGRQKAAEEREQQRQGKAESDLRSAFGENYELVLPAGVEPDFRNVYQVLSGHPVREFIKYGIILNRFYETVTEGEVRPSDVYFNLVSPKRRPPDFREAHALEKIREAMNEKTSVQDGDWIAAPIFLRSTDRRLREEEPWGGGYFLIQPPELPEEKPTFDVTLLALVMFFGTLLLIGLTYLLLERLILKPIGSLARGAERVARREFERPVPVTGGQDEIQRLVATFNSMMEEVGEAQRDLTERVDDATRREAESRRGLVIAQRLAATGTLASGIAHEINNPLGGMLNASLRLQREAGDHATDNQRRYLDLVVKGLMRVQDIVQRVLKFTPRQVEPRRVGVLEVVSSAVDLAEHRADTSGVEIHVSGDNPTILVEPGEIQQVFLNLLINACDAMAAAHGGVVEVVSRQAGGFAEVEVRDRGPGMTAEQIERAFDLFFTTKEVGVGTGLGLSVAHHIVHQHGGQLTVSSEPGKGSVFTVRLPVAQEVGDPE